MLSTNGPALLSSFTSSSSSFSLFSILMGTEGTDGESSSPYWPSPPPPPFPDVCILIILVPWLAPCTLFTHSSIHIHLACTCLVPIRVTWRESTHKTDARAPLSTNTDRLTHICSSSPLRRWGSGEEQWRCQREGGRKLRY